MGHLVCVYFELVEDVGIFSNGRNEFSIGQRNSAIRPGRSESRYVNLVDDFRHGSTLSFVFAPTHLVPSISGRGWPGHGGPCHGE